MSEPKTINAGPAMLEFAKTIDSLDANKIDPDDELDWYSLIVGYFLAKGYTPDEAWSLATAIHSNGEGK